MGNVMDSFFTGFSHSIGNFFGSPLDFLSGKSCRLLWTLVSCWVYMLSYCCTFFCYDLLHTKRRRRHRNHRYTEDEKDDDGGGSPTYHRSRRECRREERLRKSLRPRSHRVRVGVRKDHRSDSVVSQHADGVGQVHGITVSRETKFARKGSRKRTRFHHGPRKA